METLGTQYAEAMISSLNYTLGRTSSAIVDRREVKIKPRGSNTYSPAGQRTIEFTLTDSASYLLLNTMKLQFRLQADAPTAALGGGVDAPPRTPRIGWVAPWWPLLQ